MNEGFRAFEQPTPEERPLGENNAAHNDIYSQELAPASEQERPIEEIVGEGFVKNLRQRQALRGLLEELGVPLAPEDGETGGDSTELQQ